MPPQAAAKSPVSGRLRSGVHGEWSETTQSIVPSASARHSASRLAASRIGGQHLNSVAPSGTVAGVEGQVVRAGLGGDPHAVAPGPAAISGSAPAADRCRMCTRAPVARAASIAVATARALGAGGREARKSA